MFIKTNSILQGHQSHIDGRGAGPRNTNCSYKTASLCRLTPFPQGMTPKTTEEMHIPEELALRGRFPDSFWRRLSEASSCWLQPRFNAPEKPKQPSEVDNHIEENLQLLSEVYEKRKQGRNIDPFMGFGDPSEQKSDRDAGADSPLVWSRDELHGFCWTAEDEGSKTLNIINGEIVGIAHPQGPQGYSSPVSRSASPP